MAFFKSLSLFQVKPVEYVMLNVIPHWHLQPQDRIQVLPNGLDLGLSLSFHDDEGNQFDAVRSSIMVEYDQKVIKLPLLIFFPYTMYLRVQYCDVKICM